MSDQLAEAARRIGIKGQESLAQIRRMIRRELDRHDLAARLFIAPDGQPSAAAVKWFRDLAAKNFVNGGAFHQDPREHAYREGRRDLALEIIRSVRLDAERIDALVSLEREAQ